MAIDKPVGFVPAQEEVAEQIVELGGEQFADGLTPNIELMPDGSAIVGEQENLIETTFDMNLAEALDDNTLGLISSELRQAFEDDKASR